MQSAPALQLAQSVHDNCALSNNPATHSPCIVVLVHPLLDETAVINAICKESGGLCTQSAGVARPDGSLADALFDEMLRQCCANRVKSDEHTEPDLSQFAFQRAMQRAATRCEQLAARAAITDAGVAVRSAHGYLATCTRHPLPARLALSQAYAIIEQQRYDYDPPGSDYSPDRYFAESSDDDDDDEKPLRGSTVEATMQVTIEPWLAAHQAELATRRAWNNNDPMDNGQQVELIGGARIADDLLMRMVGHDLPAYMLSTLRAMQRTESMQMSRLYSRENTLYLIVSVSDDYMRLALGCMHQWMVNNYQEFGADMRCAISVRMAALIRGTWDQLLTMVPSERDYSLTVDVQSTPQAAMSVQSKPSRYLYMDDLLPVIARCCLATTRSMVEKEASAVIAWSSNPGTMQRVGHSVAHRGELHTLLTVLDSAPGEDVTDAFHRLFGINYIHGEFYTHIEMRPSDYEVIPDRPASAAASILIAESDDE